MLHHTLSRLSIPVCKTASRSSNGQSSSLFGAVAQQFNKSMSNGALGSSLKLTGRSPNSQAASPAFRKAFSSEKGGLDTAKHALEEAAEARIRKLKAGGEAENSIASKIARTLKDALGLTTLGTTIFAGYYTWSYKDVDDLEKIYKETRNASAETNKSKPGDGASPPPSESSGNIFTEYGNQAWCFCISKYLSVRKAIENSMEEYANPTYHKLLPDMMPQMRGNVKTLVLDLDDLLVHKEWTRQSGWKIYKRPGVQEFIQEMGSAFEVVVYTDEPSTYADPILNKLDPNRSGIWFRLYRPETQYHKGKHVRDLSKLNRDLSQVLMISANPEAWTFQPDNCIKMKPWTGDAEDTGLLDLMPMLMLIALRNVGDLRQVVRSYDGEPDVPKAFKARMSQAAGHPKGPKHAGFLGNLAKA